MVNAQDAQFTTSGNTCTAASPGKINGKLIQDVPFIKMQIGASNETAMIRSLGDGYMAVTCLDANGYIHAYSPTGLPTMGTYYSFTPTVSGTLTVTGAFDPNGKGSKSAQLYIGKDEVKDATIAFKAKFEEQTGNFNLEAEKTYYLYVPTDDSNYDVFCLHSFSFKPDFYFKT